jgi:hypothetical protein
LYRFSSARAPALIIKRLFLSFKALSAISLTEFFEAASIIRSILGFLVREIESGVFMIFSLPSSLCRESSLSLSMSQSAVN